MDSQGRSRLIIGGLSLAAVFLVISLLLSQQRNALPLELESPLVNDALSTTPVPQPDSPLAVPASESPLSIQRGAIASLPAMTSVPLTDTASLTEAAMLAALDTTTATESADEAAPISVTARSTVTVTILSHEPVAVDYDYEVIATFPHDPKAYTQGLQYVDGQLYEGTGLNGQSSLRLVNLETGEVLQQVDLDSQYFGEGIYVLDDRIYQLTWQSHVAFLYDRATFALLDQFSYPTEGWGLTYDGQDLLMSDGSSTIFRRDPVTFEEVGRIEVFDGTAPVRLLNELEYIDGSIWANIYRTNMIAIIDPTSGQVTGRLNLEGILPSDQTQNVDVLNGIAYDEANDRIFVTGKLWPTLFQIKLVPR